MKAKYNGKCRRCRSSFPAGTEIVKDGDDGYWKPVNCPGCIEFDAVLAIEHRVEDTMLLKHRIALGCFGIPDGAQKTFTRRDFFDLAQEHGLLTENEHKRVFQANRLIWDRDLSD